VLLCDIAVAFMFSWFMLAWDMDVELEFIKSYYVDALNPLSFEFYLVIDW